MTDNIPVWDLFGNAEQMCLHMAGIWPRNQIDFWYYWNRIIIIMGIRLLYGMEALSILR